MINQNNLNKHLKKLIFNTIGFIFNDYSWLLSNSYFIIIMK